MKEVLFTILILLGLVGKSFCQTDTAATIDAFKEYLSTRTHFPAKAREDKVSGQVIAAFWFGEDKTISDIKILKGIDDNSLCEDETVRSIKAYPARLLKLKSGEYSCSLIFARKNQEDEEINDFDKVQNIKSNYPNFLFETTVLSYGSIRKLDITDGGVAYKIPSYSEHKGITKSLIVNAFVADKSWKVYKDSLYFKWQDQFDKNGDLIKSEFYRENEKIPSKTIYNYDKPGLKTQEINYWPNGEISNKIVTSFDAQNRITDERTFYGKRTDTAGMRIVFEYNNKGLKTLETTYYGSKIANKKVYKYIGDQLQVEDDDNPYGPKSENLKYFKKGLLAESYGYFADFGFTGKSVFIYNDQNQLLSIKNYSETGVLQSTTAYQYDKQGNKIEEIGFITDRYPKGLYRSTFEYSDYDKKGNWRKLKWLDQNTHKSYIVTRQIVY